MGNDKLQGEGDYQAACRFQEDEKKFVEEHTKGGRTIEGDASAATNAPTAAEREGLARARDGSHDQCDAECMHKLEAQGD